MNCQNCDAPVSSTAEHCEKCGAKLLRPKVFLGVPRAEHFTLTAEEPQPEVDEPDEPAMEREWRIPPRLQADQAQVRPRPSFFLNERAAGPVLRWGGFFRRLSAFFVDMLVIVLMSALLGVMAFIGYKVGLSAHDRVISWNTAGPLVSLLTLAWMGLATLYFVTFHGMEGKTIGKWLLGLRVVGMDQRPISYRRALLRCIGAVGLGFVSLGLAFLWILWQREKRGWHDFLARTWVIRD